MIKKCISLLLALSFMSSVAFAAETSTIAKAQERKVLRVGFSSFVPWAMQNKAGEFIGFEIDVATRLAEDLGLRLQLAPTSWNGIIPALLSGKFDVIIGGMGVTEERAKQVDFTQAYDNARFEVLASKERAGHRKTIEDFNKPEVIITVRTGSSPAIIVKEVFPNATIRQFADEAPCVEEVRAGRADAFISSAPLPSFSAVDYPDKLFVAMELTEYEQPIAFAVRKNDQETLDTFNAWIEKVKAEGWLKERTDYWFRTKDWEEQL